MNTGAIYPDLKNKKVFITGATRGIGKGICLELARQKAHIIFPYRNDELQKDQLCQELKEAGAENIDTLKFDITETDKAEELLKNYTKEYGPIEALVNNAGISNDQLLLRMKKETLEQTMQVNLIAAMHMTRIISRGLLKIDGSSIVNISSIIGLMGNTAQSAYAASKAGLIGFTKSVAKELGGKNIRCNAVCPGIIETDMTKDLAIAARENYNKQIPLKRTGNTQDVAKLVCFLLSKESAYITGEIIKIDGGLYI